jgi:hypothetical protein
MQLQVWSGLHPIAQLHARRGTRGPRPLVRGTRIRLEVEHLPRPTTPTKPPQPLWCWWWGPTPPDPAEVWQAYVARYSIEHAFRCFKQTLKWTTPRLPDCGRLQWPTAGPGCCCWPMSNYASRAIR